MTELDPRQRGFTLLELLIVVAILGALAAIVVPSLVHALHSARQKRTMASMRGISEGIEMYEQDWGFFPVHNNVPLSALAGDLAMYVRPFDPRSPARFRVPSRLRCRDPTCSPSGCLPV